MARPYNETWYGHAVSWSKRDMLQSLKTELADVEQRNETSEANRLRGRIADSEPVAQDEAACYGHVECALWHLDEAAKVAVEQRADDPSRLSRIRRVAAVLRGQTSASPGDEGINHDETFHASASEAPDLARSSGRASEANEHDGQQTYWPGGYVATEAVSGARSVVNAEQNNADSPQTSNTSETARQQTLQEASSSAWGSANEARAAEPRQSSGNDGSRRVHPSDWRSTSGSYSQGGAEQSMERGQGNWGKTRCVERSSRPRVSSVHAPRQMPQSSSDERKTRQARSCSPSVLRDCAVEVRL